MTEPVLIDWSEDKRAEFRQGVMTARHRLHMAPEFTDLALAALLERHPRHMVDICTMGDDPSDFDSWRGGSARNLTGTQLLEAVREGKLWINVREAMNQDPVYKPIFDALFAQLRRLNPGYRPVSACGGILISSPKAQVFYHCDPSETLLLHVKGVKRFRIYPPRAPWLHEPSMEGILHKEIAEDMPYDPAWDADAATMDLTPGSFVSWPLHAPHRVENIEGLNVSITCEVVTKASLMRNAVLHANGAMRRMGLTPRSSSTKGVQALAKLAFSKAWKGWMKIAGPRKPIPKSEETFEVDLGAESGFRDRAAA